MRVEIVYHWFGSSCDNFQSGSGIQSCPYQVLCTMYCFFLYPCEIIRRHTPEYIPSHCMLLYSVCTQLSIRLREFHGVLNCGVSKLLYLRRIVHVTNCDVHTEHSSSNFNEEPHVGPGAAVSNQTQEQHPAPEL